MTEEWRPVVGYEGLYEVSDLGRVRGVRRMGCSGSIKRTWLGKPGSYPYPTVGLYRANYETKYNLHALVARAFLGARPEGMEVRHLNGDPEDNRAANLAYGTSGQNKTDQVRHGTHPEARKTHCKQGHPFSPENTYVWAGKPNGRSCRACHNAYTARAARDPQATTRRLGRPRVTPNR